jgi:myosin heavy subunit
VQEEYRREGLTFKRVDFVNNDATVSLLDGTGGILRSLEDVCR